MSDNSKKNMQKALNASFLTQVRDIENGARNTLSQAGQNYLAALVDPANAPESGIPASSGGYPGRTGVLKGRTEVTMQIGTLGFGYISTSPYSSPGSTQDFLTGPLADRTGLQWTTNAYGANTVGLMNAIVPGGVQGSPLFPTSPYQVSSLGTNASSKLSYRVVGHAITIFPTSSFSQQNGQIYMLEAPNHNPINLGATLAPSQVSALIQCRIIRATQTGAQSEKIVLNWHPRSGSTLDGGEGSFNDLDFVGTNGQNYTGVLPVNGLIIMVTGLPGTSFECIVDTMFEVRGSAVVDVRPRTVDSRAMDLIFNALAMKVESGYVGIPRQVESGYLAAIWGAIRKGGEFVKENEKSLMKLASGAARQLAGFTL